MSTLGLSHCVYIQITDWMKWMCFYIYSKLLISKLCTIATAWSQELQSRSSILYLQVNITLYFGVKFCHHAAEITKLHFPLHVWFNFTNLQILVVIVILITIISVFWYGKSNLKKKGLSKEKSNLDTSQLFQNQH